jgi:hypothetical protein
MWALRSPRLVDPPLARDTSAPKGGFYGSMTSPLLPPTSSHTTSTTSSHRAVPACHVPIESGPPHRRYLAAA